MTLSEQTCGPFFGHGPPNENHYFEAEMRRTLLEEA